MKKITFTKFTHNAANDGFDLYETNTTDESEKNAQRKQKLVMPTYSGKLAGNKIL